MVALTHRFSESARMLHKPLPSPPGGHTRPYEAPATSPTNRSAIAITGALDTSPGKHAVPINVLIKIIRQIHEYADSGWGADVGLVNLLV